MERKEEDKILSDGDVKFSQHFTCHPAYWPCNKANCVEMPISKEFSQHAYLVLPRYAFLPEAIQFDQFDLREEQQNVSVPFKKLLAIFGMVCAATQHHQKWQVGNPPRLVKTVDGSEIAQECSRYWTSVSYVKDHTKSKTVAYLFHLAYTEIRATHDRGDCMRSDHKKAEWDKFRSFSSGSIDVEYAWKRGQRPAEIAGVPTPDSWDGWKCDDSEWLPDFDGIPEIKKKPDSDVSIRFKLDQITKARSERRPDYILADWIENVQKMRAKEDKDKWTGKKRYQPKSTDGEPQQSLLTPCIQREWVDLACYYMQAEGGHPDIRSDAGRHSLYSPDNVANLFRFVIGVNLQCSDQLACFFSLFTAKRAALILRGLGGHPSFSDEGALPDSGRVACYPEEGRWTWRIDPYEMNPDTELPLRYMPDKTRGAIDRTSEEFLSLCRHFYEYGLEGKYKSGTPGAGDIWTRKELQDRAENHAAVRLMNAGGALQTLDGIRDTMRRGWKRIEEEFRHNKKSPEYAEECFKHRMTGLLAFVNMYNSKAPMPNATLAIAKYTADHLNHDGKGKGHGFGRMRIPLLYSNVSPYAATKIAEAKVAELSGLYAAHSERAMVGSLSLTVYDMTKMFKSDVLILGAAGAGKSHLALDVCEDFIPGTYDARNAQSDKADHQETNKHLNLMMRINEEVPPGILGYDSKEQRYNASRGSTDNGMSAVASSERSQQTSQVLASDRLEKKANGSGFYTRRIRLQTKCWRLYCNNLDKSKIAPNMLSRYICMTYQHPIRKDKTKSQAQAAAASELKKRAKERRTARFRRNQAFVSILDLWIHLEIIPPVTTFITDSIMLQILDAAVQNSLTECQDIRGSERIKLPIEVSECITHAIAVEFDGCLYKPEQDDFSRVECKIEDVDFNSTNMTMWFKLLRAALRMHTTVEQLVYMLSGLGPHTFEDPVGPVVIDAINEQFNTGFGKAKQQKSRHVTGDDRGRQSAAASSGSGSKQGDKKYGKQTSVADTFQKRPSETEEQKAPVRHYYTTAWKDESKFSSTQDRCLQLANMIHNRVQEKRTSPVDHCAAWLRKQAETMTAAAGADTGSQERLNNIMFTDKEVHIAISLLSNNKTGRLRSAIHKVLEQAIGDQRTFLLGTTLANKPHTYHTLDINPKGPTGAKSFQIPNVTYLPKELRDFETRFLAIMEEENEDHIRMGLAHEMETQRHVRKLILDKDADDYSALKHVEKFPDLDLLLGLLKIPFADVNKFLKPSEYNPILLRKARFKNLPAYPPTAKDDEQSELSVMALSEAIDVQQGQKRKRDEALHSYLTDLLELTDESKEIFQQEKRRRLDAQVPLLESPVSDTVDGKDEKHSGISPLVRRAASVLSFENVMSRDAAPSPHPVSLPAMDDMDQSGHSLPRTRTQPPPVPRQRSFHPPSRRRRREAEEVTDAEAEAEDRAVPAEPGFDFATMNFEAVHREIDARRRLAASQTSVLGSLMQQAAEEEYSGGGEEKQEEAAEGDAIPAGEDGAEGDGEAELAQELKELQESESSDSSVSAPENESAPPVRRLQRLGGSGSRSPSPVLALDEDEDTRHVPSPEPEPEPEPVAESVPETQPEPMQTAPAPAPVPVAAPTRPRRTFNFLKNRPRPPVANPVME